MRSTPHAKLCRPKVAKTTDELLGQMKATPEEAELVKAVNDGPYTEWTLKALRKKLIRLPEDNQKLVDALALFTKLKRSPEFKKTHSPNINDYRPADLYALGGDSVDLTSNKEKIRDLIANGGPGAKLIADKDGFKVFFMTEAKPLTILASNTQWCVANLDTAETYMQDGPAFMFYQGGKPFALLHPDSKQFMDPQDNEVWHGIDYNSWDDHSNTFFMNSRTPYYAALMVAWQTPELERLVDEGDFPEIVTEDADDYAVSFMFEREALDEVLKYYACREAAGVETDADTLGNIIALVVAKPEDNLRNLLWDIRAHGGPNELAIKVAQEFPDEIVEAFQSLDGNAEAEQALDALLDTSRLLKGDTNWTQDTMRAIGATFSVAQILSHFYPKDPSIGLLSDVDTLLLQGAIQANPEQAAQDLFKAFKATTKAQWGAWLNSEFITKNAPVPKTFYDAFRKLLKPAPAKASSMAPHVKAAISLVPQTAETDVGRSCGNTELPSSE